MIRENIMASGPTIISGRTSLRMSVRGIVALTNLEEPGIARIYDISLGGVSFLHLNDLGLPGSEIKMDIIIYFGLTNVEYFISDTKGKITSKERIPDPQCGTPILRFGVEFLELDLTQRDILAACMNQVCE
jgi:hypothetical protein